MEGAVCQKWTGVQPENLDAYGAVVFQKLYDKYNLQNQQRILALASTLQSKGQKVFWDLCDPIWWWNEPEWVREFLDRCTGVVVSNACLANDFEASFGIRPTVIRDRQPFVKECRIHEDVPVPKMVWFGYAMNRGPCLSGVGILLSRLCYERVPFTFRVIDDHPSTMGWDETRIWSDKCEYVKWDESTIHQLLCECDVALLPPFPGPWGKMKSNNKAVSAWWAGLPVHDGQDYYELRDLLLKWGERKVEGVQNRMKAESQYEVSQSVDEWNRLLATS
jgi:hypothetical protein